MKLVQGFDRWRTVGLGVLHLRVLLPDNQLVKYVQRLAVGDTFEFPKQH